MIHENAWELLPDYPPDDVAPWVNPALDAAGVDDQRHRMAYCWAHALLSAIDGPTIRTVLTADLGGSPQVEIADISAGFIPFHEVIPDTPGNREQQLALLPDAHSVQGEDIRYSFGIVIGISGVTPSDAELTFASGLGMLVSPYDMFPIILERRVVEDAQPVHPAGNATSTCFARPRSNKRYYCGVWTDGILLARHVLQGVGTSPGTAVSMQGGATSTIVDIDQSTNIDAAIIDATSIGGIPPQASPIALASAAPPGGTVTVRGKNASFTAAILRVMDDSRYFGNMVAHRVFIDAYGVQGDSGALVTSAASDAVGLYMGKTGGAVSEGLLQSIRQVCEYFQVDLLD